MVCGLFPLPAGRLASGVNTSYQISSVLIARDQVRVSLYTIPGTALAEETIASLDRNRDGVFSAAEDRAYAAQAFRDVRLEIDGKAARPRLIRVNNTTPREIRGGLGSVEVVFDVDAPERLGRHTVVWRNRHLPHVARREFGLLNDKDPGLVILSKSAVPNGSWAKVVYDLRKEPKYFGSRLPHGADAHG